MEFEETAQRLVVRRDATKWFIVYMGYMGLFLLPMSLLMGVCNVASRSPGSSAASWLQVAGAFLFGVFGVALLHRAPLHLEIVADRGTRQLAVRRVFRFRKNEATFAFSDVKSIATRGAAGPNMSVVTCSLRTQDGQDVALIEEGGFRNAQADTRDLAEKVATFVGVPLETT